MRATAANTHATGPRSCASRLHCLPQHAACNPPKQTNINNQNEAPWTRTRSSWSSEKFLKPPKTRLCLRSKKNTPHPRHGPSSKPNPHPSTAVASPLPPRRPPRIVATLQQPSSQRAYSQHQPVRSKVARASSSSLNAARKGNKGGGADMQHRVADHPQRPCVGELCPTE